MTAPIRSFGFASNVFHIYEMEKALPKKAFQNIKNAREGKEKFDPSNADLIAQGLKDWALQRGATHFAHWFQPLSGSIAEKHDSFLQWADGSFCKAVEQLEGKDLLRGEPDASSFPTGGLRATHQARGYTVWDPSSDPFLLECADGLTLYIPSLFFSWTGFSLDHKIPLLRSEEKIGLATMRLLRLCQVPATKVFSTLGLEQEFFAIDRNLFYQRPDLVLSGRTVFGAKPIKGQELEDHYFGPLSPKISAFMKDFEERALRLGIPLKTRHNEVAPSQHEVAPIFTPTSMAVDHNLILMDLIGKTAAEYDLAALFHEKPFAGLNGSGKHSNWSLGTDTGLNLLDPRMGTEGGCLLFLTLLAAVVHAVHDHAGLLRASIASIGNDYRLGGAEAPPTILSVYLGEELEKLIDHLVHEKEIPVKMVREIHLGLSSLSPHEAESCDRNRTSFFAFTGNKFEFRAVGASSHPAFPVTTLNTIVADQLNQMIDEIEREIGDKQLSQGELFAAALPCLRRHFLASRNILFGGNAYTEEWKQEASNRGLPNISKSFHAFSELNAPKTIAIFQGVLSEEELKSRFEVAVECYVKKFSIETHLLLELFRTEILPASIADQKARANAIQTYMQVTNLSQPHLCKIVEKIGQTIEMAIEAMDEIEKIELQTKDFGWEAKGKVFAEILAPKIEKARTLVDSLEKWVDSELWPFPKYRELLFS